MSIRRGSALRASRKVMPILSYVLERMGYTTSCVGIKHGGPPRGYAPRGVPEVDPSTLGRIIPNVTRLPQVLLHFSDQHASSKNRFILGPLNERPSNTIAIAQSSHLFLFTVKRAWHSRLGLPYIRSSKYWIWCNSPLYS